MTDLIEKIPKPEPEFAKETIPEEQRKFLRAAGIKAVRNSCTNGHTPNPATGKFMCSGKMVFFRCKCGKRPLYFQAKNSEG